MIDFRIERGWSFEGHQMWILDHRNGKTYIAKPIELIFTELDEGVRLPEPTLRIAGPLATEFLSQVRKALAGYQSFDDADEYKVAKRVEKAMQDHINSLKTVLSSCGPGLHRDACGQDKVS